MALLSIPRSLPVGHRQISGILPSAFLQCAPAKIVPSLLLSEPGAAEKPSLQKTKQHRIKLAKCLCQWNIASLPINWLEICFVSKQWVQLIIILKASEVYGSVFYYIFFGGNCGFPRSYLGCAMFIYKLLMGFAVANWEITVSFCCRFFFEWGLCGFLNTPRAICYFYLSLVEVTFLFLLSFLVKIIYLLLLYFIWCVSVLCTRR